MRGVGCHAFAAGRGAVPSPRAWRAAKACVPGDACFRRRERIMIQVDHLTKYFGNVLAVDDVSFQVEKNEIVGLLGNNGAGKTTIMRILTTYIPASIGVARVAGFDVMNDSMEVRKRVGYLPESIPLYPEMRVSEYLDYRAKLKGVGRKERPARIAHCLDRCRVREVERRLVGTLSKG